MIQGLYSLIPDQPPVSKGYPKVLPKFGKSPVQILLRHLRLLGLGRFDRCRSLSRRAFRVWGLGLRIYKGSEFRGPGSRGRGVRVPGIGSKVHGFGLK